LSFKESDEWTTFPYSDAEEKLYKTFRVIGCRKRSRSPATDDSDRRQRRQKGP